MFKITLPSQIRKVANRILFSYFICTYICILQKSIENVEKKEKDPQACEAYFKYHIT